ncbi:hypothetical protein HZC30_00415 [Candidatus Woesearchaeota archaeon]|nr:hypothetical protein [Candidatus Woesearchaeota archaeon]
MFLTVKTPGRIGDFLKELKLTEGKNTGFRKIRNAMEVNGSPAPIFITDDERVQFITKTSRYSRKFASLTKN